VLSAPRLCQHVFPASSTVSIGATFVFLPHSTTHRRGSSHRHVRRFWRFGSARPSAIVSHVSVPTTLCLLPRQVIRRCALRCTPMICTVRRDLLSQPRQSRESAPYPPSAQGWPGLGKLLQDFAPIVGRPSRNLRRYVVQEKHAGCFGILRH